MDREYFLQQAKHNLHNIVQKLSLSNIEEMEKEMQRYLFILRNLNALNADYFNENAKTKDLNRSVETDNKNKSVLNQKHTDQMVREIVGGLLPKLSVKIPEKYVRKLNLEHGDWVKAVPMEQSDRYYFELVKKGEGMSKPGRCEVKYGIVEKKGEHTYVVRESIRCGGETFYHHESPLEFIIHDSDVTKHAIKEGDIVDLAYFDDKPEQCRVTWKHYVDYQIQDPPRISGYYKERNKAKKEYENLFLGQSILLIGGDPKKEIFKHHIEMRNGTFLWAKCNAAKKELEPLVKQADIIIILIPILRHQTSNDAVELCKKYGKRFKSLHNIGVESVLNAAYEGLFVTN